MGLMIPIHTATNISLTLSVLIVGAKLVKVLGSVVSAGRGKGLPAAVRSACVGLDTFTAVEAISTRPKKTKRMRSTMRAFLIDKLKQIHAV